MPTPGLSLVGFMDQHTAIMHLQNACLPANPDPVVLTAQWQAAASNLGAPITNAGRPTTQPIPAAGQAHIQQLASAPWVAPVLAQYPQYTFMMLEVDALLAFQTTVCEARSNHHCGSMASPPSLTELLECCLPLVPSQEDVKLQVTDNSAIFTARSLNFRTMNGGLIPGGAGVQVGLSLPLVHVVEFRGRFYLHNGFHRAVGARRAGATSIPCLVRPVATAQEIGLNPPGTFDLALLESANPPTVGHYTQGRAQHVQLREMSRVIHVSWFDYVVPRE